MRKTKARRRNRRVAVSAEQRYRMINDAAYFRVVRRQQESGKPEDQARCWCEVEAEIDAVLKGKNAG